MKLIHVSMKEANRADRVTTMVWGRWIAHKRRESWNELEMISSVTVPFYQLPTLKKKIIYRLSEVLPFIEHYN